MFCIKYILNNICFTIEKIDSIATKTEKSVLYFLGGPVVDHNKTLTFTLHSTRDANPPVFLSVTTICIGVEKGRQGAEAQLQIKG